MHRVQGSEVYDAQIAGSQEYVKHRAWGQKCVMYRAKGSGACNMQGSGVLNLHSKWIRNAQCTGQCLLHRVYKKKTDKKVHAPSALPKKSIYSIRTDKSEYSQNSN